jgi:hypothetical protein
MELNKEYFQNPYYFFLKTRKDSGSLYYSISNTLSESRKKDERFDFDLKDMDKVRKIVMKIIKDKKIKTIPELKKVLTKSVTKKDDGEISEFVDETGAMKSSRIPNINHTLSPNRTMDQTILNRMTNNPVTRGYRRYYGENESKKGNIVNETDFSDAFGYEETKEMDGPETFNYFVNDLEMDPIEAMERTKQFGKDPSGEKTKKAPKRIRNQKGFIDRMTLAEKTLEENAVKMIEDILMNSKTKDYEVTERESPIKNILKKNVLALKNMAEKNGLSVNELIKMFKSE